MNSPSALPPVQFDLDLAATFATQRQAFAGNPLPPAAQRRQWLKSLREALLASQAELIEAIGQDFEGRSADETLLAELLPSVQGLRHAE
ncbi:MAG: coniferyl-aldehyde dehydrogenase, partial [Pseudomonas asiatica]